MIGIGVVAVGFTGLVALIGAIVGAGIGAVAVAKRGALVGVGISAICLCGSIEVLSIFSKLRITMLITVELCVCF